ncbi:MAG: cupin domain-containing protein [Pyrinomonadaceae bacterium]
MEYRIERWERDDPPEASELIRLMRLDGYEPLQWSDAPGTAYSEHSHGEDQSHWIVSGKLELTVGGVGRLQLGPGDRDHMPAGTMHSARVLGTEPVVYLIGSK